MKFEDEEAFEDEQDEAVDDEAAELIAVGVAGAVKSAPLFCVAVGTGLVTASMTPEIHGPGWLGFGGVYLIAWIIGRLFGRRSK